MAENVQEVRPPEPPPKPPEVPKPTEQSRRSEANDVEKPNESQQSAQQDARDAARSEHAKAMKGREPDGLPPTPEAPAQLDEHSAATYGPEALRPTSELPERSDAPPDDSAAEIDRKTAAPAGDGDRNAQSPAGEQAGEYAAVQEAVAAERAKAAEDAAMPGEAARPQSVQDLTPQPDPLPEAKASPLDHQRDLPSAAQPPELPLHADADPITTSPPGESPGSEQSTEQRPEVVDENSPDLPVVEQVAQHEPDVDQNAGDGHQTETAAAQSADQNAQRRATEQNAPDDAPTGNEPKEPGDHPPGPKDGPSARNEAAEHDDAKVRTDIVDEIASSPVDIRTKPHVNSAGETVDRYIIDDAEDLLPVAEHFGIGELSHDKDDYYSGQLPDGRYRKIEWNMKGHPNTNEGPHVKVMETEDPSSPPSRGNRWKTKAMIFVEGHEQFKKQWH